MAYHSGTISLYPHHDRPYSSLDSGSDSEDERSMEHPRNKNHLVISTTAGITTDFEVERGGSEALSPIQEASPADEGSDHPSQSLRKSTAAPTYAPTGRRLYQPRHQRLDFTRSRLIPRLDASTHNSHSIVTGSTHAKVFPKASLPVRPLNSLEHIRPQSRQRAMPPHNSDIRSENGEDRAKESQIPQRNDMTPPRSISRRGFKDTPDSLSKTTSRDEICDAAASGKKSSNARYDFLNGAVSDASPAASVLDTKSKTGKSYLERLAGLEEIEKSGQDLLEQLSTVEEDLSTSKKAVHRKARDTIFVANTISSGRETIDNIKASMDEDLNNSDADASLCIADEAEEFDDDADDEIDWTLSSSKAEKGSRKSMSQSLPGQLYSHANTSISDYLREIETSSDHESESIIASIEAEGSPKVARGESQEIRPVPEHSKPNALQITDVPNETSPAPDDDSSIQAPMLPVPDNPKTRPEEDVPPDSPTFLDFDLPRNQITERAQVGELKLKERSARTKSTYKHKRTSSFYGDHWHVDLSGIETLASPTSVLVWQDQPSENNDLEESQAPCDPDGDKENEVAEQETSSPSARTSYVNRRRSNSAPVGFAGSAKWRQSLVLNPDVVQGSWRSSIQPHQDQKRALPNVQATVEIVNFEEVPNQQARMLQSATQRESTMSELVITREDALGIFPPFKNRMSLLSRRESRGNTLATFGAPQTAEVRSRPNSTAISESLYDVTSTPPLPSTAVSESYLARSSSTRASLLKKKNIRKLKISTPTLVASSSNIPTVDLQQARIIHTEPHLCKSSVPNKSRSRLRELLSTSKNKMPVPQPLTLSLKESQAASRHQSRQNSSHTMTSASDYADLYPLKGHRRPVNDDSRAPAPYHASRIQSPCSFSSDLLPGHFSPRNHVPPVDYADSGFASSDGRF